MQASAPVDPEAPSMARARREMIEASGRLFQLLGLPRSTGQIFGLLYLASKPLSLDDIAGQLAMSKASASIGTRHLGTWGAIRPVWVPGDRRDYFECEGDIRSVLRRCYNDVMKPRLRAAESRVEGMLRALEEDAQKGLMNAEEQKFCSERIDQLARAQKQIAALAPFAEKLL